MNDTWLLANSWKKNRFRRLPVNVVPSITFNGTNQYAIGINGTNGFDFSAFANKSSLTFNCLITLGSLINTSTVGKAVFDISDSVRGHVLTLFLGIATAASALETITLGRTDPSPTTTFLTNTIPPGFLLLTVVVNSGSAAQLYINGVLQTGSSGTNTNVVAATQGLTVDRIAIGASALGTAFNDSSFREISFVGRSLTGAEVLNLANYYLSNLNRSLKDYALYNDAAFIELYTGDRSGTGASSILLASKSSTRNLRLVNF